MKWVVFVVLMTPSGEMNKMFNGGPGWSELPACIKFVTSQTPTVIQNIEDNGLLDGGKTLMGIGCYEKHLAIEELVIY